MVKKVIKKNDKLFCKFCGREMPYMVNAIGEYRCVQCQHIIKTVKVKKTEPVKTVKVKKAMPVKTVLNDAFKEPIEAMNEFEERNRDSVEE